jgi:hypothetical protein
VEEEVDAVCVGVTGGENAVLISATRARTESRLTEE